MKPATLRRRVTLAFATLGLALCGLLVAAVLVVTEDYEAVLARAILRGQADDYALRIGNGLPAALPQTQRLAGYRGTVPAWLARLEPGMYEDLQYEGQHVGVFDTSVGRLYFVADLGDIEHLETRLDAWLAAFVAIGVALSAGLGGWLAGRALRPLQQLADAVGRLEVTPSPTRLADGLPADELGRLAGAIDDYQARLAESEARQQAFFADASHELRTPIAVVRGVTEVMLDDPPGEPGHLPRLKRLDRGVRELGDLTEALLAVARSRPLHVTDVDLVAVTRQALESVDVPGWTLTSASPDLATPAAQEVPALVRMLVRGVSAAAPSGVVAVEPDGLRFVPATAGSTPVLSPLVHRLADRIGCRLSQDRGALRLELPPPR